MNVLGLMSGTSADGVDAVLAHFGGNPAHPRWRFDNLVSIAYPSNLKQAIINLGQSCKFSSKEWLELSESITEVYVQAAQRCDPLGKAEVVGCHGQTVIHRPPVKDKNGASLQLLQASILAGCLKRPVVFDFRAADMVVGGQGAPLTPSLDEALFGRVEGWRGVLNLGGISNLTLIPPLCGCDRNAPLMGWDCGPANSLIDLAVQKITNGKHACDLDGKIAGQGVAEEKIIEIWLKEPYFAQLPPKSTGRDLFGLGDMNSRRSDMSSYSDEDFLSTLTGFSAAVVAQDLDALKSMNLVRPIELLVAGGGCHNPVMILELVKRCSGLRVVPINELGLPPMAREALEFGLLAWWHVLKYPGNSPSVTGARRSVVMGIRVDPP